MGKIEINYNFNSLVLDEVQYANIKKYSPEKVVLALPTEVLNNLIRMFEQREQAISYDAYGKAIQFDPDCHDLVNNLFDAIFEGRRMPTTYEVSVTLRVEADDEEHAERRVRDALDLARGVDEYDIEDVNEYD